MTKPSPRQNQPEDPPYAQDTYTSTGMGILRRISVKGAEGAAATVVVTTYREQVWMSIVPLFMWEAIMELEEVDELMHVLGLARQEAEKMAAARRVHASRGDRTVVREIPSGTVGPGNTGHGHTEISAGRRVVGRTGAPKPSA